MLWSIWTEFSPICLVPFDLNGSAVHVFIVYGYLQSLVLPEQSNKAFLEGSIRQLTVNVGISFESSFSFAKHTDQLNLFRKQCFKFMHKILLSKHFIWWHMSYVLLLNPYGLTLNKIINNLGTYLNWCIRINGKENLHAIEIKTKTAIFNPSIARQLALNKL